MSILNDAQRDDDPRMQESIVIPPPPPPPSQSPPLQLGAEPLPTDVPLQPAPDFGGAEIVTPEPQPGLDSSVSVLGGEAGLPGVSLPPIDPSVAGGLGVEPAEPQEPDYQVPDGFGEQKPLQLQVIEEQLSRDNQALQQDPYEQQFTQGSIVGAVQDSSTYTRENLKKNSDNWYGAATRSVFEVERSLRQQAARPNIPPKPNVGSGNFDPDPLRPAIGNPEDQSFIGQVFQQEWVQSVVKQLSNVGAAVGFRGDGKTFDPWYGGKRYLDEVREDPTKLLQAPLLPFIVGATGKYGEYGEGLVGSAMYLLSLPQNVVLGASTDAYQLLTGKYKNKTPNVVQGLLGKAFDFTQERSDEKPFSVIGKNSVPTTWSELRGRNIVYGLNPALALGSWISKVSGGDDKIPESIQRILKHPDGGTWLRVPEVVAGLALDLASPSLADIGKAKAFLDPSSWSRKKPTPPTEGGQISEVSSGLKPDKPQNVKPPTVNPPGKPDTPQELSRRLTNEVQRINTRANNLVEQAKKQATPGTTPRELTQKVNNIRAKSRRDIQKLKGIYSQIARLEGLEEIVPAIPTPAEVARTIVESKEVVEPTSVVSVVRTNEELTKLAIANGDYLGTTELTKTRLDILKEVNPVYSRVGSPITEEVVSKVQLSLPPARTPLSQAEVATQLSNVRKQIQSLPAEEFETYELLSRQGDELANQLTEAPTNLESNPARLQEIQAYLPEEQVSESLNGIRETSEMLLKEKLFQETAEIASSLAKEQEDILSIASKYIDNLDDEAPDLGRRSIQNPIEFTPEMFDLQVNRGVGLDDTPDTFQDFIQKSLSSSSTDEIVDAATPQRLLAGRDIPQPRSQETLVDIARKTVDSNESTELDTKYFWKTSPDYDNSSEIGALMFKDYDVAKPGKFITLVFPKDVPPSKEVIEGAALADELLEAYGLDNKGTLTVVVSSPDDYARNYTEGFKKLAEDNADDNMSSTVAGLLDPSIFNDPETYYTGSSMYDLMSGTVFLRPNTTSSRNALTIVHEFAHKLAFAKSNDAYVREFMDVPDIRKMPPSDYALLNDDEFVAEAVAFAVMNRRKIAPQLRQAVTDLLAKVSGREPPNVKPANQIGFNRRPRSYNKGDIVGQTSDYQNTARVESLASSISGKKWYHGTKVANLNTELVDPFTGGSRGELGVGLYLTTRYKDAVDYALASPSKNLPNVPSRQFSEVGSVVETNVVVNNPVDATAPMSDDILAAVAKAIKSSKATPENVRRALTRWLAKVPAFSLEQVYAKVDAQILKMTGYYSEELGLDISRRINSSVRALGYDAIAKGDVLNYLGTGDTNRVYINRVTRHGSGDLTEQATHRYNADTKSLEYFPDSGLAQANQADSSADLLYRLSNNLDDISLKASEQAEAAARALAESQMKLKKTVAKEKSKKAASKAKADADKDAEMIRHNNKIDEDPCL